jgi:nicotinamidase-related amidase
MRHPQILRKDDAALLVVDIQERLVPAIPGINEVIANTGKLIFAYRKLNGPIIITEQYPKGLGPTDKRVISTLGELYKPIEKMTFSCCGPDEVNRAIVATGAKQILVCGIETHVCVLQTVLDLLHRDYQVHLAADAVSSRTEQNKRIALDRMGAAGAVISCTESALFELMERAGTPEFKEISKIII